MTFEKFMDENGYGYSDFDRCEEMENLIEEYAESKSKIQAISTCAGLDEVLAELKDMCFETEGYDAVINWVAVKRILRKHFTQWPRHDVKLAFLHYY